MVALAATTATIVPVVVALAATTIVPIVVALAAACRTSDPDAAFHGWSAMPAVANAGRGTSFVTCRCATVVKAVSRTDIAGAVTNATAAITTSRASSTSPTGRRVIAARVGLGGVTLSTVTRCTLLTIGGLRRTVALDSRLAAFLALDEVLTGVG